MFLAKIFSVVCLCLLVNAGTQNKRGLFDGNFGNFGNAFPGNAGFGGGPSHGFPGNDINFAAHSGLFNSPANSFAQAPIILAKPIVIHKVNTYPPVSPAEIASAISAAKEATNQVLQAQQRVQLAKESVLNQQRLANQKETQAAITAQKAEAAAAVQRQEANAAATSVVLAQQRLAQAKAEVAEHQRIAAAKEAHAAHVIHKSANAAAEEIQKSQNTAAKLAALQRSEATVFKHASAAKDATLSAASAAVAASASHYPQQTPPWIAQPIHFGPWQ